uniref:NADH-ubiquinone oxidoreductase chain 4L n=1 Tax=Lepidophyma flavimaculatum TaxID=264485 RepID=A1IGH7_9SAUR|nr:NADH dehydrogenase subunit 4L [Lepidophyma flavimaculatum]BAF43987.1 NADH dehydrogenase subunit 4L [Lepidophyma flavimaculatum]
MTILSYILNTAFMLGLVGLSTHRTHLMSALLCLESMMLALFIMMVTLNTNQQTTTSAMMPIILLAFSACEASTGLSILVATARTHGMDNTKNFNLLKC